MDFWRQFLKLNVHLLSGLQRALPVRRAAVRAILLLMRKVKRLELREEICRRLVQGSTLF